MLILLITRGVGWGGGWEGDPGVGGMGGSEGYMYIADSLHCAAETSTTL